MFYAILSLFFLVETAQKVPQTPTNPQQFTTSSGAVIVLDRIENGKPVYRYISGPKVIPVPVHEYRPLMPIGSSLCPNGVCPKR